MIAGILAVAPVIPSLPDSFEYTVSLGNLLTIGGFVVFITIYIVNSRGAANVLATRMQQYDATVEDFKIELKKLSDVLIGQAQQDGRINLLEQRMMQEGNRVDKLSENIGDFKNMVLQDTLKRPGARQKAVSLPKASLLPKAE